MSEIPQLNPESEPKRKEHVEKEQFEIAFQKLKPKEQQVINLRFGLGEDGKIHTLNEVGEIIGLTDERARQIQNRAIAKLAALMTEKELENLLFSKEISREDKLQGFLSWFEKFKK